MGKTPPMSVLDMSLKDLMVRLQIWSMGNVVNPFIAITPRSTQIWRGSTC